MSKFDILYHNKQQNKLWHFGSIAMIVLFATADECIELGSVQCKNVQPLSFSVVSIQKPRLDPNLEGGSTKGNPGRRLHSTMVAVLNRHRYTMATYLVSPKSWQIFRYYSFGTSLILVNYKQGSTMIICRVKP